MVEEQGAEVGQAIDTTKLAVECGILEGEGIDGQKLEKLCQKLRIGLRLRTPKEPKLFIV